MYLLFDVHVSLVAFTCAVVRMNMQKPGYRYHMLLNFLSNIWSLVEQSFQITTYTVVVLNLVPRVLSYSAPMARERERDRETLVSSGHVSRWQNKVPGRGLFYWTFCRSLVLTLSKQGCYYQALRLHIFAMFYSAVCTLLSSTVTSYWSIILKPKKVKCLELRCLNTLLADMP